MKRPAGREVATSQAARNISSLLVAHQGCVQCGPASRARPAVASSGRPAGGGGLLLTQLQRNTSPLEVRPDGMLDRIQTLTTERSGDRGRSSRACCCFTRGNQLAGP